MSIYLDHAATTPMTPSALSALVEASSITGNASSTHSDGRGVRKNLEQARELIAECASVSASEIIFTSSGTESNNLAIKGLYWKAQEEATVRSRSGESSHTAVPHIIVTSKSEHHAVLDPIEWLVEHQGAQVHYVNLDEHGFYDLDQLEKFVAANSEKIALITLMHANNEIGTINDIARVCEIARRHGAIPVHSDLVQSFGKVATPISEWGIAAATISAHKLGGPLGVAALYVEHGRDITPVIHGGGHEREMRSGTLNVPSAIAFATAVEIAFAQRGERNKKITSLRNRLCDGLMGGIDGIKVNGAFARSNSDESKTLPGILNVQISDVENDALLLLMDSAGISASAGSACTAGVPRPSHVLLALGLSEAQADSSIRFSLSFTNTEQEIDEVIAQMPALVEKARAAFLISHKVK
jgi:cysteine desulfurase